MKYKGQYEPSQLLCPVTFQWVDLKECIPKLEEFKFCAFSSSTTDNIPAQKKSIKRCDAPDGKVMILYGRSLYLFRVFKERIKIKQEVVKEIQLFCDTVGPHALDGSLVYYLSSESLSIVE